MKHVNRWTGWFGAGAAAWAAVLLAGGLGGGALAQNLQDSSAHGSAGFLYRTNYHGWEDSIWISNGKVEAIVVPAVGRVMQFRLAGTTDGPFWENESLRGAPTNPGGGKWLNFGGDKVWPSPQGSWSDIMSTNWPPPVGFDGQPAEVEIDGWVVTLHHPPDKHYGIQVSRRIQLAVDQPSMQIETWFDKTDHPTMDVGIWVMTQLKEPLRVYARLQMTSLYSQGFQAMSDRLPPSLEIRDRLLSMDRDPRHPHTVGIDVGSLLWMTEDTVLKIDSPRLPYRSYPNKGASATISTLPDPQGYVELAMYGPVKQLRIGGTTTQRSVYTLLPRTEVDPDLEAARLLKR